MDHRSIKARSVVDNKSAVHKKSRPLLSERHKSAPLTEQRKQTQTQVKRLSDSTTSPASFTQRLSKLSVFDNASSSSSSVVDSSPPPSRSSGHSQTEQYVGSKSPKLEEEETPINILVLGNESVGKSQFVSNILDLRRSLTSPLSAGKVALGGRLYRTKFVELLLDDVDFNDGVRWPRFVNGQRLPQINGVFLLYDACDLDKAAEVPHALAVFSNSNLPCILVATKKTPTEPPHPGNSRFQEKVRRTFPRITVTEAHLEVPESPKHSLLLMLNRILHTSRSSSRVPSPTTSSPPETRQPNVPSTSKNRSRSGSRSRSQSGLQISKSKEVLSSLSAKPSIIESESEEQGEQSKPTITPMQTRQKLSLDMKHTSKLPPRTGAPHTPVSSQDSTSSRLVTPLEAVRTAVPRTPDSYQMRVVPRPGTADTSDSQANQTFLNMDESSTSESGDTEEESLGLAISKVTSSSPSKLETGIPFPDLVDRLLRLPTTKQESKFVPSFLCLYRLFATPRQLLVAIIERFVAVDQNQTNPLIKTGELLRYLQVLGHWTAWYPGDFAPIPIHQMAVAFAQGIEKNKNLAPAAREITNNLGTLAVDIDMDWAYEGPPARQDSLRQCNTSQSRSALSSQPVSRTRSTDTLQLKSIPPSLRDEKSYPNTDDDRNSLVKVSTASSVLSRSGNKSSQSYTNLSQLQQARQSALRFDPRPHIRLSKVQWHQFMDTPLEDLVQEITRIDWTMYSAIRPRDYVRHVSLTSEQRKRFRTDDNISMMVKHFNHLALFVSGMILLRDKPKHRAKALEKFMMLAKEIRQKNNYNSLGAVVAGVTGHEIGRLTLTRDLIPPDLQKQFLSLTVLMSTSRSHATYRMAWENTSSDRIPFVPLLRQDLTMAASANQTFLQNGYVNWKKFEIMGDVIVGVQRSLEQPYTFQPHSPKSDEILKLIVETKIVEESEDSADPRDELYERSILVEPSMPATAEPRKKFEWRWR